jgi:hypothetical protein
MVAQPGTTTAQPIEQNASGVGFFCGLLFARGGGDAAYCAVVEIITLKRLADERQSIK